jgi:hypothetical protein
MDEGQAAALLRAAALARSGMADLAWRVFKGAALDRLQTHPASLSLHGRLLKDRARRSRGMARREAFLEAADRYLAAARLDGRSYPLINAATTALLGGDRGRAAMHADELLARMPDPDETPYYQAATRAEALLLNGEVEAAIAALDEAIALAPRAWEDHATTLRQFALILDELDEPPALLDRLRPPRVAHFCGPIHCSADPARIRGLVRAEVASERIGFAYGALAAGADILIAEALAASDVELHIVLPGPSSAFFEACVAPFGEDWRARFEALLAVAASVSEAQDFVGPDRRAAVELAGLAAMGEASRHARRFETEAVQLLAFDPATDQQASMSRRLGEIWRLSGRRQHRLPVVRTREARSGDDDLALASLIAIEFDTGSADRLEDVLRALSGSLQAVTASAGPSWAGNILHLSFAKVTAAAQFACAASTQIGMGVVIRIGGHLDVMTVADDPLTGAARLFGPGWTTLGALMEAAPAGAMLVTQPFVAALDILTQGYETERMGELDAGRAEPLGLWTLRSSSSDD